MNKQTLAALLLGLVQAASAAAPAASHYLEDAKAYLVKGQLKEAEIQLKNALREDPQDLEARITLGRVALREGDIGAAERDFKTALASAPPTLRAQILPLLGEAYLRQGKAVEILTELETDYLPAKAAAQILNIRARALLIEKDPAACESTANAALALQPEMPDALLTLAMIAQQQGDREQAEHLVDRALAAEPDNSLALDAKGELRAQQGDQRQALIFYGKALTNAPGDDSARLGEAAALLALRQDDAAGKDIDLVLRHQPAQPAGLYLRALMQERQAHYAEALATLDPAKTRFEDSVAAQILLGELNLRAGHVDQALAHSQHALSLAPNSLSAKLLTALILDRQQHYDKVKQLLEPVAASPADNEQVEMILGDVYGKTGHFDQASKALAIALKEKPNDAALRVRFDASQIGAGHRDDAIRDLQALLIADPDATGASVLLISTLLGEGRIGDAVALGLALGAKRPKDAVIDRLLGRGHWMLGDWPAAEADFQAALQKQPSTIEAANDLVLLRQVIGQPTEADLVYAPYLPPGPQAIPALLALSRAADLDNDPDRARQWLDRALASDPDSVAVRLAQIELALRQKQTKRALAIAEALSRSVPDQPAITLALARSQRASNQEAAAIASMRHWTELQPIAAAGQRQLGITLAAWGHPTEALVCFKKAVLLDPNDLAAWRELAALQALQGGLDSSLALIRTAHAAFADGLRRDAAFAVKRSLHDNEGARRLLTDWLKSHPDDADTRATYADLLMENKQDAAAIHEYQTLLARFPVNVALLNNLAWLTRGSDPAGALAKANLAFGLAPQSVQVRDSLAEILLAQGDSVRAAQLLRPAHAQSPDDSTISEHLALAQAQLQSRASGR
jgi:putative PEP-CTERM system TPR-repeat lipoprotein